MIPAPAGVGRNIRSAAGDKNAGSIPLFGVGPVCIITLVENAIVLSLFEMSIGEQKICIFTDNYV